MQYFCDIILNLKIYFVHSVLLSHYSPHHSKPFSYEKHFPFKTNKQTNKQTQFSIRFFLIFLFPIMCTSILSGQNFPEKVSKQGVVFDGKLINRTTSWSADKSTIYTINWFEVDDLYYGQLPSGRNIIPVLTEGGATEKELLVISHALNFHKGYNYLLALEPCSDCLENAGTYLPMGSVGKFNKITYIKEKKKWATQSRITTDLKDSSCEGEESTLLISFSNVHVEIESDGIHGYVDLKTKTTDISEVLYNISSKIKYASNVFGENVIVNQNLDIHPIGPEMQQAYTTQALDVTTDKAKFSTTKNSSSAEAMLIDTFYQSLIRLTFDVDLTNISELPNNLNELFLLEELDGTFFCEGKQQPFTNIIVEDRPIGIAMDGKLGGITYSIDNVAFDEANQDYFFTIFASSTETTFLRQSILRFDYSSTTFFPSQVASGNVQIINEPGTIVSDNSQYNLQHSDLDNNSYRLVIGEISVPQPGDEYAILTTEPVPLVRLKFETQNCAQNPMLFFQELEMQGISYHLDEDIFPFFAISYDPVVANDFEQIPPCGCEDVNIDSHSPAEIVAGDNQILTITGSNFGVYQRGANPGMDGTGSSVLFKNGDFVDDLPPPGPNDPPNPPEFIGAGEADFMIEGILKWTDTEIQVKVPSTDWEAGFFGPAATGKFIVRNGCNEEDQHPGGFVNLRIPHSLMNTRLNDDGKTKRLGLRNNNGMNNDQSGYEFEFHPNVNLANINIKDAFTDALSTWCDNTNIRFTVKNNESPPIVSAPRDGRNTISVNNLNNPNAQAALRLQQYFQLDCGGSDPGNDEGGFIMTDLDFLVHDDFALGNDQNRAERVFTHELGHAHMLNHAYCFGFACRGPVMHPRADSGIKDVDVEGGNKIYDDSQIIISNACFLDGVQVINTQPIQSGNCGNIVSIKEFSNYFISLHPNPTMESVFIDGIPESIDFKLINMTGQILHAGKASSDFTIQLSKYPQGAYWLNISNGTENSFFKIIKL